MTMLTGRPIIVHCIDKGSIDRTLVSLRFNTAMDIVTDVCSKSNRMARARYYPWEELTGDGSLRYSVLTVTPYSHGPSDCPDRAVQPTRPRKSRPGRPLCFGFQYHRHLGSPHYQEQWLSEPAAALLALVLEHNGNSRGSHNVLSGDVQIAIQPETAAHPLLILHQDANVSASTTNSNCPEHGQHESHAPDDLGSRGIHRQPADRQRQLDRAEGAEYDGHFVR